MKALYFPYTSPEKYETILRALLIYEEVGAIRPKDFFLTGSPQDDFLSTPLEQAASECKTYGSKNPIFILDPVDLIKGHEDGFANSILADMKNPFFQASAPRGAMELYASKITRPIFEGFRGRINRPGLISSPQMKYREGPYLGSPHFMWSVQEPLAHSILLNLTQLGLRRTNSVPVTDSRESHLAFLAKVSRAERLYDVNLTGQRLIRLVLPEAKKLNVRTILNFRDDHRTELRRFWRALAEQQKRVADTVGGGSDDLYFESRIEFEGLRESIKSAWTAFKWGVGISVVQLVIGVALKNPGTVSTSPLGTAMLGTRYIRGKRKLAGFSYLLSIEEELGGY